MVTQSVGNVTSINVISLNEEIENIDHYLS